MKNKLAILIITVLLILSLACNDGGGDTTQVTATCFDHTYNECRIIGNSPQICADFANLNCNAE